MERERIRGVALKIESTPLTDSVPGVADALAVVGTPYLEWGFLEPGLRDDVVTGDLGRAGRAIPAGRWGKLEAQVEVRGSGAAYAVGVIVPDSDVLLRIGGLSRTFNAGAGVESILYTTNNNPSETATMYCYEGTKLFKLVGCVATLKLSAQTPQRGFFTATISGVMTADPVDIALPALVYPFPTILPPLFHTATATIGAWSSASGAERLVLKNATIDFGNVVSDLDSAGALDGHAGYLIADRSARQEMLVNRPQISTLDLYALAKLTGTALPLSTWQIGTAQYNRLKVQTGYWQLEPIKGGSQKSLITAALAGNLKIGAAPTSLREVNLLFD